ncbi:unnamed protein product [Lymnaea stagnalis]|uniref:Coiled-coil domain-containing protein 180 n=1 Tax=Lymnaea stagnalis TaxID=6523 RepID=A0AAV2HV64_LYMST
MHSPKIRVVPSGQIYRQLFDAQLQLNKSLSQYGPEFRSQHKKPKESVIMPVIHLEKEDTQHGILTSRQKTWVEGYPNDPYVENPVLYKQFSDYINKKLHGPESNNPSNEVRALPDIIVSKKQGSNIIERISEGRKQRHEAAVKAMHEELSVTTLEIEELIQETCADLLIKLQKDEEDGAELFLQLENNEQLKNYSWFDLNEIWKKVQSHTQLRHDCILQMDNKLKDIETKRMQRIKEIFSKYGDQLFKIAYLAKSDLQRLLDKESQMINQMMLTNQRSYADLYFRLISANIEREKGLRNFWQRRVEDWRTQNCVLAVESFREFMQLDAVTHPPTVELIKKDLQSDQGKLNSQRIELVKTLCSMQPPNSTKSAVYKWRNDINVISAELDSVNQMYLSKLHAEYEKVCQMCLEKIDQLKESLISAAICSPHRACQLMDEFMLPLVGEQQSIFEEIVEALENEMENHKSKTEGEMMELFKFSQGAAHLWDVHEIGLARLERTLQEKLEDCRHKHDQSNQEKEANLDIVMDRMRQDGTDTALKDSLLKALTMLEKIREFYEEFHKQETEIVKGYPKMVRGELDLYEQGIFQFFALKRKIDREENVEEETNERKSSSFQEELVTEHEDSDESQNDFSLSQNDVAASQIDVGQDRKEGRGRTEEGQRKSVEEVNRPGPPRNNSRKLSSLKIDKPMDSPTVKEDMTELVKEILKTSKGTEFYVLKEGGLEELPNSAQGSGQGSGHRERDDTTFMTEVEQPDPIQNLDIPNLLILQTKHKIRQNFLEHLEEWYHLAVDRAKSIVVAKCEELNSELDLRVHLHLPRPRRAELDVHNVRAAELVLHSERVARHCAGLEKKLSELTVSFKAMSQEHNKLANKFYADIQALEVIFVNATKSSRLVKLQNQLTVEQDKFMSVIRTSLREFRQQLDKTLQMLRESNARFIKAFKTFSDGGNFCPEEIEDYRRKLEKMSHLIDSTEGNIMSELEGMEFKRLDTATKVSSEFEDRFKGHLNDLVFMERVARWLTNTQVKIKSEVANSNGQAQNLVRMMDSLEQRIDACQKPHLEKEVAKRCALIECLPLIECSALIEKCSALIECSVLIPSILFSAPAPPPAGKVNFTREASSPAVIARGSKSQDDQSVGIIKSILKKLGENKVYPTPPPPSNFQVPPNSLSPPNPVKSEPRPGTLVKSKQLQSFCTCTVVGYRIDSYNCSVQMAGLKVTYNCSLQLKDKNSFLNIVYLGYTVTLSCISLNRTSRNSRAARFDKRMMMFVDSSGDPDLQGFFIGVIQSILRQAADGLLSTAEVFYLQKEKRPVTRPQALQETYEQCAEVISQKLQSYYSQADEYHNQSLQEFREQLVRLEELSAKVPPLVIDDLVKDESHLLQRAQQELIGTFKSTLKQLTLRKESHQNELRPNLGHPHLCNDLEALCVMEEERHLDYMEAVEKHTVDRQEFALQFAKNFLLRFEETYEKQLEQYDNMLVVDDVDKGRADLKLHSTSELIRRKLAGKSIEDEDEKTATERGRNNWLGVPSNQFVLGGMPSQLELTATVATKKTTLAHSSTIQARDKAYQKYKECFDQILLDINDNKEKLTTDETRWRASWQTSVKRVKSLYQKE